MTVDRPQPTSRRAHAVRAAVCIAALLFATVTPGCSYVPSGKLSYAKLALPYDRTQLKSTTSLEVLNVARDPAYQFKPRDAEPVLLTQSDTAVAYSGRSTNGRKTWLDLIAFDEFRMTAARKYFFCLDERATTDPSRPRHYLFPPRKGILFDSEFAIDPDVLTTPYATDEARKAVILKWLAARFQNDVTALVGSPKNPAQGNEQVTACAMMVNQMFQGILVKLAKSPGLAKNLATDQGIQFRHASLGEGRLRLLVENDTAAMTIRVNLPLTPLPR
ncbi:MAG: hypothetical protein NTZ17_07850 [Phycisphaerae bacterium]|nr:hypothetical protein [Phycisphaerae bacterium]